MVFSLRDFVKTGLLLAVGKMADYQIILTPLEDNSHINQITNNKQNVII